MDFSHRSNKILFHFSRKITFFSSSSQIRNHSQTNKIHNFYFTWCILYLQKWRYFSPCSITLLSLHVICKIAFVTFLPCLSLISWLGSVFLSSECLRLELKILIHRGSKNFSDIKAPPFHIRCLLSTSEYSWDSGRYLNLSSQSRILKILRTPCCTMTVLNR